MRGNIKGAGFYLYRPNAFGLSPREAVERAASLGAAWIAPRVLGWADRDPVNWDLMGQYRAACDEFEISLGGWGYHVLVGKDGKTPPRSAQGRYEPEAIDHAIATWDLDFYVVNSEVELKVGLVPYSGWAKRDGKILRDRGRMFWETLRDLRPDYPIGMTSYRFPKYHAEFIWDIMLNPEWVDFNQPQVYWILDNRMGAGAAQLQRSVDEFKAMGSDLPISPLMGTYPHGSWYATDTQVDGFIMKAQDLGLESYGAYTLEHSSAPQREAFATGWKPETGENTPEEPQNPVEPPQNAVQVMWEHGVRQNWW